MAVGDKVGLETVQEVNEKTLPAIETMLHALLERLNGATITITINIPPRSFDEHNMRIP